jgi:hypothetical protein
MRLHAIGHHSAAARERVAAMVDRSKALLATTDNLLSQGGVRKTQGRRLLMESARLVRRGPRSVDAAA